MNVVDCNEIDEEENVDRRRLQGEDEENEVQNCEGDFIRSLYPGEAECDQMCDGGSVSIEFGDSPQLVVVDVGVTLEFDNSDYTLFEFGTLDGCDNCMGDEQAEDNEYNRIISNKTMTSITMQERGYRCFMMDDDCDTR